MRLAERTDYALRVLMLLASSGGRHSVPEMAGWYGVSANHLSKVVQALEAQGWVATHRGRGGGVDLAVDAADLKLGDVVRAMEPDLALVECFRDDGDCPINGSCGLWGALHNARRAFLDELDRVVLKDLVTGYKRKLLRLTVGATA